MTHKTPQSHQELLLICGMHRSGTSVVTHCFELFGYSPGDNLMEPGDDNPTGFFEDLDVVGINDRLLLENGSTWDAPIFLRHPTKRPQVTWTTSLVQRAVETLKTKFKRAPRLAIKDPRVCLTLPFWREIAAELGVAIRLCLVYRNPLDIAASVERRNGLPVPQALALTQLYWATMMQEASTEDFVVDYGRFVADPTQVVSELAEWLEILPNESLLPEFLGQFINPELKHHETSWSDTVANRTQLPDGMLNMAELLQHRARGIEVTLAAWQAACENDSSATQALFAHQLADRVAQIDRLTQAAAALELSHAQHGFELESLTRQRDERDTAISVLEDKLISTNAQIEALKLENAHAYFDLEDTRAQKRERDEHIKATEDELIKTQADFQRAEQARVHSEASLRESKLSVAQLTEKADWLFNSAVAHHGALLDYERSFLGRCHRLGRRLYRLLTLRRGQATSYEHALSEAHTFYHDHNIPKPQAHPNKPSQLLKMAAYTLRHPVSSFRSMSWSRLKIVLFNLRHSPAEDLAVWVNARFEKQSGHPSVAEASFPEIPADEILAFPQFEQPLVSIVIPVFNEWVVTHRCLYTLLKHTKLPYEVIVADDCSTDDTTQINDYVTGISVIRQEENQRFLKNCNLAAQHAKGDYVLFLNNDTAVTENWLEPLIALLDDPKVGIVGPKLLFPDGKLQEAGGIVWRDASGWNFGRADDPAAPAYNYVRETDYVSGAALLIRRSLWQALGGFDETFAPAYYEDTDLCFQARAQGYKVLYQPASSVVHYEGVTNGTDLTGGQKQYQVANQKRFQGKWSAALEKDHFPNAEHVNIARDRSRNKKRVLIIDHYIPHFDKDAGSRSTWMYVEMMIKTGYRVQFMGANFFPHEPYTSKLQQLGVEVLVGERLARHLNRWFTENLHYVDHIFLHRPHIAEQFLPHLKKQKICPPISFVGHDLHFLRTRREYDLTGDETLLKQAAEWQRRELAVIEAADHSIYFSAVEVEALAGLTSESDVRTVPLYILEDRTLVRELGETPQLLFVAGFNHPPNIDAALWLVNEILPLLEAKIGIAHLHIAGSNPSSTVTALASGQVTVHGYVSEEKLLDLYARSHCAVVPLRFGAGVKGKVLEAIQFGVPLVTTTVGAEGIPDAERVMAIADDASAFATAIAEALDASPESSFTSKSWIEKYFSAEKAEAAISALIDPPSTRQ